MSESRLVEAFRENERDLIHFLMLRLKSAFAAQDLAQELYVRVRNHEDTEEIRPRILPSIICARKPGMRSCRKKPGDFSMKGCHRPHRSGSFWRGKNWREWNARLPNCRR